jgi:hypothetical protein
LKTAPENLKGKRDHGCSKTAKITMKFQISKRDTGGNLSSEGA